MDGEITIGTKVDLKGFNSGIDNLKKEMLDVEKNLGNRMSSLEKNVSKTFGMIKTVIVGTGLALAFKEITGHIGDAISRLDTLNNYVKVMRNLGVNANDAQESISYLSEKLTGLPTTLDDAANAVQRFTSANNNVKASTEMFLALNNAILAGGASQQIQQTAIEQLSQSYAKGKPDMMEWRSAMTAMPAQLKQVAQAMGYVSADQLGEALRNGTVSMNDFMATLIKLNKEGANGFQSFEEQAKNSTGGIATSMANVKTAITRGLAEILNAIGQTNISSFFQGIAKAINAVIPYIVAFVKVISSAFSFIGRLFGNKTQTNASNISTSISGASSSMSELNDDAKGVGNGINNASKSAKKLKKELQSMPFDEFNVLSEATSSNDSGGGSGGTIGSAGGNLGNIDFSGFDTGLSGISSKADEIAEKIKSVFLEVGKVIESIWNSEPVQVFAGAVTTYGQFLWDYWSTLGTSLFNNIVMTWGNIEGNISTILSNMSLLWTNFWTDIDNGIQTWGQPIIDGVNNIFNSIWADAIDPTLQIITKAWADFSGILVDLWDKHGKPLIDNIGEFVTTTISLFQKIWDDVLKPIITPFLETLSWLWDKHIKGMIEAVGDFVGKLINDALEIYNKFIAPLITYLIDKLSPAWSFLSSLIIGVLGTAFGVISDVFNGIFKILGGIIDFITGVFTGNWRKAWNGVLSIFRGIIKGLVGIFKAPINFIIDGINAFISGINHIKIPDWVPGVGGKGFNINKIPKLATGGIVNMPNRGTLVGGAITGESGREGVIPLTDSQAMETLGEAIGRYITINANITNTMNGRVISRQLQQIQAEQNFAYNT